MTCREKADVLHKVWAKAGFTRCICWICYAGKFGNKRLCTIELVGKDIIDNAAFVDDDGCIVMFKLGYDDIAFINKSHLSIDVCCILAKSMQREQMRKVPWEKLAIEGDLAS